MTIPLQRLAKEAHSFGIELTDDQLERMGLYAELLLEWNQKINLTTITEPDDIAIKHFLDSLLLLNAVNPIPCATLIDVGAGAGFPSVPCAVVRGDLQVTLLDSLQKRVTFLEALCAALGVSAVTVHARAEDGGRSPALRGHFDLATARAVAQLRELAEYCLPFLKIGGVFAALKGHDVEQELEAAKTAVQCLGGEIEEVKKYKLPDGSRRSIVIIRKISQTSTKYPRTSAKIAKTPI